ncbi:MAG: response regulator [Rhodanobacteraceae bacterium]
MPRILLTEDDPISRAFLLEALRNPAVQISAVSDGDTALAAAKCEHYDLLILDHHMPGVDGDGVLDALRSDAHAASQQSIAIATTADPDPAIHDMLRGAGFIRVLAKPLDAAALHDALRELGILATKPSLDENAGLAASGNAEALCALRELFARELATLDAEFDVLGHDPAALNDRLHRLRAACGFCGAVALGEAAAALTEAARSGDRERFVETLDVFRQNLTATRAALRTALQKEAGRSV